MPSGRPAKCIMAASPARIERQKPQTASHDVRVAAAEQIARLHASLLAALMTGSVQRLQSRMFRVRYASMCFWVHISPSAEPPPPTVLPMPA